MTGRKKESSYTSSFLGWKKVHAAKRGREEPKIESTSFRRRRRMIVHSRPRPFLLRSLFASFSSSSSSV